MSHTLVGHDASLTCTDFECMPQPQRIGTMHPCCNVLQCVAVCCSVLQCVAVCCSAWQCVAVCCSVLHCVAMRCSVLQCVAMCCSVLRCVAVCCRVLQCMAYSSIAELQRTPMIYHNNSRSVQQLPALACHVISQTSAISSLHVINCQ